VKAILLGTRFGLELAALAALAYWGFKTMDGTAAKILFGVGAPLVAAVLWGLFVSPKARFPSPVLKAAFELVVFGAAVLALVAADQAGLGIAFAVVALLDSVLLRLI
jgi:Protein of unknown function (DUF2568)